jgi:hypothetical protein
MRNRGIAHWVALLRVYLERARRAIVVLTLSMAPLSIYFAHKAGYRIEEVALNLTVVAMMLPMAAGGIVGKSKADGSLAFLASLPVSRGDHARSWLALIALLSLPLAITAMVACYLGPLALRGGPLIAIGASALALSVALVMTMVAVQLAAPPTAAIMHFMTALSVIIVTLAALGELFTSYSAQANAVLRSDLFLPAAALLMWSVAGGAFWWSWHRIGHYMTSYVGDPPEA